MEQTCDEIINKLTVLNEKIKDGVTLTREENILFDIITDISPDIQDILYKNKEICTDESVSNITDMLIYQYENIMINKHVIFN